MVHFKTELFVNAFELMQLFVPFFDKLASIFCFQKDVICIFQTIGNFEGGRVAGLTEAGVILAPLCSLINHSCIPNCANLLTENFQCVTYASRPIKKNEQVNIYS